MAPLDRARDIFTSVRHAFARLRGLTTGGDRDPRTQALLARAEVARREGRMEDAVALYGEVLQHAPSQLAALRGLRDLCVASRRWRDALARQQRIVTLASAVDRAAEGEWLAVLHYEVGRAELAAGNVTSAVTHLRNAIRSDRSFTPAAVSLGDAHAAADDHREALRVWERAAEGEPMLPVLARLEHAYRAEGRPSRMIALYERAVQQAPDDLALAVELGRVYFELEMLDEAAEQFEKIEVRAPELPAVHAFLGAIFERRGQTRDAFEEFRRALRLSHAFASPYRCRVCGAASAAWHDRCGTCGRWNTLRA